MNLIREAAKNLPGRWFQGDMYGSDNSACGIGHVSILASQTGLGLGSYADALDIMDKVATEQFPERASSEPQVKRPFACFNDHPNTTEDEVVAVMEKAAVLYDEKI